MIQTHCGRCRPLLIACLVVGLLIPAAAESQYIKEYSPWPVVENGEPLDLPFFGGLFSPKPTFADFDGDGLTDLFIGEKTGKLVYLRNVGTSSQPSWEVVTERPDSVDIGLWHVLDDIDNDGDLDLFCEGNVEKVRFFRNESSGSDIIFTLEDTAYSSFTVPFNSTPVLADIDADGDHDFFVGALSGYMHFYQNTGTPAAPAFSLTDSAYDSVLAFPGGSSEPVGGYPAKHGTSSITMADITGDDAYDLFWGDINNSSLYYFRNEGDAVTSDLTEVSEAYIPSTVFGLNHTTFADIDDDGDNDMLVGVANGASIDNLRLLRNTGTPTSPNFVEETLNYISMIDVSASARQTFGDLDNDGDLDLMVGGLDGRLRYYQNTGSAFAPGFELVNEFYKGIDVGGGAAPALTDWDDDGDLDLLIGTQLGRIEYWENTGSASDFDPTQVSTELAGIKVDQLALPQPVDLNDDNLKDLVVGEWDFSNAANVLLYENTGTAGSPSLTEVTTTLLPGGFRVFAVPTVYDWDSDGRHDIILGNRLSGLTVYRNTGTVDAFPDSNVMVAQPDVVPGYDDGNQLQLSFVDIDGDLDDDVFVGEEHGGLNFYRKSGGCCALRGDVNGSDDLNISDVTYLVGYQFKGGPPPVCFEEGNVNGTGGLNISDLTYLVAFQFKDGPAPPACP